MEPVIENEESEESEESEEPREESAHDNAAHDDPDREEFVPRRRSVAFVGVVLMLASLPLWPALLIVPFLPIGAGAKALLATGTVVVAEIAFWLGAALAGPAAARRVRSWWRRRRER